MTLIINWNIAWYLSTVPDSRVTSEG